MQTFYHFCSIFACLDMDASCHVQNGKSMPSGGSFVENVPVLLGFVTVPSPVKGD